MTDLWFVVEGRCAKGVRVIFFLVELQHVGAKVIPVDQTRFFRIELDEEEQSFAEAKEREATLSKSFSS